MPSNVACPTSETWLRLLGDDLPQAEREELEGHLETCESCSAALARGPGIGPGSIAPRGVALGPETLAMLARLARRSDLPEAVLDPEEIPEIPGFDRLEEVGRGGMGVVYRARQVELDRTVAVKVLSVRGQLARSARARAVREAMTMAQLRHPNVVQVYRSGEVDGIPFLVMEWVDGGTLQGRLERSSTSFREAATMVRDLALAVAEAHALGIIHRDLKPENVLLAPEAGGGSVAKLADFGLARCREIDGLVTETGVVLGTPSYMAPEQTGLDGTFGEVGPATDIHGLGAILYASLSGKPPYGGASSWATIVSVAKGSPVPLRKLRPDVSRDLETIVEKCLQPMPARRYRSAGELADDLARYLEGRAVSARPIGKAERLAKWARRRPAAATAAVLMLALVAGGIGGAAYHIASIQNALDDLDFEQKRTEIALKSEKAANKRSEAALNQARRELGSLTDNVVQRMIERGSALDQADLVFLREVRGYYEEWPVELEKLDSVQFRVGGLLKVGGIFDRINRFADAQVAYKAALKTFDDALQITNNPSLPLLKGRLETLGELQRSYALAGDWRGAEALAREMAKGFGDLAKTDPGSRSQLAGSHSQLAFAQTRLGRLEEADRAYADAIAILATLVAESPKDRAIRRSHLATLINRGLNQRNMKRMAETEATFRALLVLGEQAAADDPGFLEFRRIPPKALGRLADVRRATGRFDEARAARNEQLALLRRLVAENPGHETLTLELMSCLAFGARLDADQHRYGDGEPALLEAIQIGERLLKAAPAIWVRACDLGQHTGQLGEVYFAVGRREEAITRFDRAVEILQPWLDGKESGRVPSTPVACYCLRAAADTLSDLGRHAEAAKRLEQLLELCDDKERPEVAARLDRARRAAEVRVEARAMGEK